VAAVLAAAMPAGAGAAIPASFSAQRPFATGSAPRRDTVADVNGDGSPDAIVASAGSDTVGVFLNTTATGASTPSFSDMTGFATGMAPVSVAAGDVNGDGRPDLLVPWPTAGQRGRAG
jgi:hypothetical protein